MSRVARDSLHAGENGTVSGRHLRPGTGADSRRPLQPRPRAPVKQRPS